MEDTDRKIEKLDAKVTSIEDKLDDLKAFKIEMMISSRWVSIIISAVCGLATMALSAFVSYKLGK